MDCFSKSSIHLFQKILWKSFHRFQTSKNFSTDSSEKLFRNISQECLQEISDLFHWSLQKLVLYVDILLQENLQKILLRIIESIPKKKHQYTVFLNSIKDFPVIFSEISSKITSDILLRIHSRALCELLTRMLPKMCLEIPTGILSVAAQRCFRNLQSNTWILWGNFVGILAEIIQEASAF